MTYRVGIDIGSTAAKACVMRGSHIAYTTVMPTGYSSIEASERLLEDLESRGYPKEECVFVATGYGRVAVPFADKTVTEITCHGKGAEYLFGPDNVVVDIGGQDTKSIVLKGGKVVKFNMNDKCSAGTGKFLEIMANRLGLSQDELSDLARIGSPTQISSMCTVFAESEVISLIGQGTPRENICWGVVESVVAKVKPLVPKSEADSYVLTGGLCENDYVVERLAAQLGGEVRTCPQARFAGAIGAALCLPEDSEPSAILAYIKDGTAKPVTKPAVEKPGEPTFIVSFNTTNESLAFDKMCRERKLPGRLAPLPNKVSAGCGYCWQAAPWAEAEIREAAADAGCSFQEAGVYEL